MNTKKQDQVISTAVIIQEEIDSSSDWEEKQASKNPNWGKVEQHG